MLLSVSSRVPQSADNRLQPISAFLGTSSLLPEDRQTRWGALPGTALRVSCRYSNRVRPPAVHNPRIYLALAVTVALQTHRYPEMSGLHSRQLPTENAGKSNMLIKFICFKEKQPVNFLFFFFKSLWQNWLWLAAAQKCRINELGSFLSSCRVI